MKSTVPALSASSSSTLITSLISDGGPAAGSESGPPKPGGGGSRLVEETDVNGKAGGGSVRPDGQLSHCVARVHQAGLAGALVTLHFERRCVPALPTREMGQ